MKGAFTRADSEHAIIFSENGSVSSESPSAQICSSKCSPSENILPGIFSIKEAKELL
jgi:hypothetical protein